MGFLDLFRKKNDRLISKQIKSINKLDLRETLDLIEENKFVNDDLTMRLFDHAYEITNNNVIDRHFLYNQLINYYYGLRDIKEGSIEICKKYCKESIELAPMFLRIDEKDYYTLYKNTVDAPEYKPPRIPAFQRMSIILDNEGKYHEAIKVCQKAIELNLRDGTKGGFEGRIKRLQKKIKKGDK